MIPAYIAVLFSGAFILNIRSRLIVVAAISSIALAAFGAVGAKLGGAPLTRAAIRVLLGGWIAMGITYGILRVLGHASMGSF
jgi:VIT1/CCC1 family predicted Fe2+/Mn2+ transporter